MGLTALLLVANERRRGAAELKQFRILAMAHLGSLLLLEMNSRGEATAATGSLASSASSLFPWTSQQQFALWLLGLHVLYFGLSLETKKGLADWQSRLLHGPSFGGSHALLLLGLWSCVVDRSVPAWRCAWLYVAPVLLHQADVQLGKDALQQAYSPALGHRPEASA